MRNYDDNDQVTLYHGQRLHQNRERVEFAAMKTINDGIKTPTILLLELSDDTAREIAYQCGGRESVDNFIAEIEKRSGVSAMNVWHMSGRMARALVCQYYPVLADSFGPLDHPDKFLVVVVAAGGATVFEEELPAVAV